MSASLCTEDILPIVEKLTEAYPTNLSEVDPDRILFLRKQKGKRAVTLSPVRNPWDLCTKYKFVLCVYASKFDALDENKQAIAIFDELIRIKDFETSTLKGHSVVGNFETLAKWGMDWQQQEQLDPIFEEEKKA